MASEPVACVLCGELTSGSTGASGMVWPCICQPCKDREDRAALDALKAGEIATKMIDKLMEKK